MKTKSLYELNRKQQYIIQMRPLLIKDALFSDGTEDYRFPTEAGPGETVTIRFRAGKDNVDIVRLCTRDYKQSMDLAEVEGRFEYYETQIILGEEPFYYYFEIMSGCLSCFYDRTGVAIEHKPELDFCILPGFSTPGWAKGAVMYQIFVDRFFNGNPENDVLDNEYHYIHYLSKKSENWEKCPDADNVAEFYGGDLEGIRKKLDYLQNLGVEVLYLNPVFVSPSNHKYDTQDYDYIDPHFGRIVHDWGDTLQDGDEDNIRATRYQTRVTDKENLEASNQMFAELVQEIHARGMKIILDGVFNHCGSFNKWMDRERIYENKEGYAPGAYVSADSPYRDYFKFYSENDWPYNGHYVGWWGHDTLPELQYEQSQQLENYILNVARKWLLPPYEIDGWRLDVAADLGQSIEYNHAFWKKFRKVVKETNPEALILAEHYGDAESWLKGKEWDSVMNYDAFMEPLTWYMTGVDKHSENFREEAIANLDEFTATMDCFMHKFSTVSLQCSMNELSNHDHSRFLTRTNHKTGRAWQLGTKAAEEGVNKAVFRAAVVVQFTWPGAPTIYYGDEAGLCGFTDPDNRRTYPWGNEDRELIQFHRDIIKIHKQYQAFRTGSLKQMNTTNNNILCYGRFTRKEQFIIIVNPAEDSGMVNIQAWQLGIPRQGTLEQLLFTNQDGFSTNVINYDLSDGCFEIHIPKCSAVILKRK
ncbi:MAG: glycoside hydrolase family 13 protein [Eubacterium sp.]|nr:glycoside hydrolase family 13 protein [Eubacterium sp.]